MPEILAIWEAEIGRNSVLGQSRKIIHKTQSPKMTGKKKTGQEVWLKW
jgi:hypothetical protein